MKDAIVEVRSRYDRAVDLDDHQFSDKRPTL